MKLQIEKRIYGGAGLARHEGKAIFVPFTLPGEVVEAHIMEDKRSYASAELDAVLEPSQRSGSSAAMRLLWRVRQDVPYQHASYTQQVAQSSWVFCGKPLERACVASLPEIVPVFAEPLGYP